MPDPERPTMRHLVDAFISAVEDARRELIRQEGRAVSVRELIRRAGFPDSRRASVAAHLNPRIDRPQGHRVPPDIVKGLAEALSSVISEDELARAAQAAAGYTVTDTSSPDVAFVVSRFYGDEGVTDEEKAAVTARLLQIIAEETSRNVSHTRPTVTPDTTPDDTST